MNQHAAPANAQGYSLIDAVPENATMQQLPTFKARLCSLFQWKTWSAISWIRIYYLALVIFFIIIFVMETVWSFWEGEVWLIVIDVLSNPLLALMCIAGTRIVCEVMMAVLMMPHQLFQISESIRNLRSTIMPGSHSGVPFANMGHNESQQNSDRLPSYHMGITR